MTTQYSSANYDAAKQRLLQLQSRKNGTVNKSNDTTNNTIDNIKPTESEQKENTEPSTPTITTQLQQSIQQCDTQYQILQNTINDLLSKYGLAYTADIKLQPIYNKLKSIYTTAFNNLSDINTTTHNELSLQQSQLNSIRIEYENKLKQQQTQHNTALKRVEATIERKYTDKIQQLEKSNKRTADMREHLKRELRVEIEQTMHNEYNQSITEKINELRDSAGAMLQNKQNEIIQLINELTQNKSTQQQLELQYNTLQQQYERIVKQSQVDQKLIMQQSEYLQASKTQNTALQQQVTELKQSHTQQCTALTATISQSQQKLDDREKQHSDELQTINTKVQGILSKKDAQIATIQQHLQQSIDANTALQTELLETKQELNNML